MYDNDLDMIRSELETYANYIQDELPKLYMQIYDLKATAAVDNYGVSSPRIKSTEEAKYQTSPKVYTEDAVLQRMIRREEQQVKLQPLEIEYAMKRLFVIVMQKRIIKANLTDEERQLLWYRFFKRYPLRAIAMIMNSNKDTVRERLIRIMERL
ncbi:MAG: hypothetical protein E7185_09885 [Erysipelotrichaceae bacterium]|nr:hypothetical protein [Erysipelotrichaceae bacterium]